jgi:hypothetical protein
MSGGGGQTAEPAQTEGRIQALKVPFDPQTVPQACNHLIYTIRATSESPAGWSSVAFRTPVWVMEEVEERDARDPGRAVDAAEIARRGAACVRDRSAGTHHLLVLD